MTLLCVADSAVGSSGALEARVRDANLRALVFLTVTTRRLDGLTQVVTGTGFIHTGKGEVLSCGSLLPEVPADYSNITVTGSVCGRDKEAYHLTIIRNDGPNDSLILQLPARSEQWPSIQSEGTSSENIPFIALGFSTSGEAIATRGTITGNGNEADYYLSLTDAAFQLGMTGGPALDYSGAVIGIIAGPAEYTPSLVRLVSVPGPPDSIGAWSPSPTPTPDPYAVPVLYATNRAVHLAPQLRQSKNTNLPPPASVPYLRFHCRKCTARTQAWPD